MNCDNNFKCFEGNDCYRKALEKIKKAQKECRCCCICATCPTDPVERIPTLTIGTVTTGAPGTDASASITGAAPNYVLNLTIPQGSVGPAA